MKEGYQDQWSSREIGKEKERVFRTQDAEKNTNEPYQVVWRKNHPTPVTFDPKDSEGNKNMKVKNGKTQGRKSGDDLINDLIKMCNEDFCVIMRSWWKQLFTKNVLFHIKLYIW